MITVVSCCVALCFFTSLDGISEHLRSLFIDVCSQTIDILQFFDKDSDGSSIICEVAPPSPYLKPVDVCCNGLLFLLLDLHEMQGIGMDVSIAKFGP